MSNKCSLSDVLAFLRREKDGARERIKQCQIFLSDDGLMEADGAAGGTLRESLEQIRENAEEDFGSFLHLLTVIKAPEAADEKAAGSAAAESDTRDQRRDRSSLNPRSNRSKSPSYVSEDELDPNTMFEHTGTEQNQLTNLVQNAGDLNGSTNPDELLEEDDYVPNLPASSINATSAGVARTSGRFVHRAIPTSSSSPAANFARSLPVSVPPSQDMLTKDMLPPELREEDMTPPEDILSSIQNIAKSLHTEGFSVEQPRTTRMRVFSGAD